MNSDYSSNSVQQRVKEETLERPTLRSRGLTAPDPFSTRERIEFTELPDDMAQLSQLNFEATDKGVIYRKKTVQDSTLQVQVKIGPKLVKLKSGAEYLSEGFRTMAIEMKDMLVDLNKLSKMLARQQFEQTEYFAS